VGIAAIGAVIVQADGNGWQNAAPASGTDYAKASGAAFNHDPPTANCPASTITCP
jgi:hypothetical protein